MAGNDVRMVGTEVRVHRAEAAEAAALTSTMAIGFWTDPLANWCFTDPSDRLRTHRVFFGAFVDLALATGEAYATDDHLGVALWFDVTAAADSGAVDGAGAADSGAVDGAGAADSGAVDGAGAADSGAVDGGGAADSVAADGDGDGAADDGGLGATLEAGLDAESLRRFGILDAVMTSNHPHDRSHAYLGFIAVHPDHQGRGIGSLLLRDRLAVLDAAGRSAYLEASCLRNAALYQRHGFQHLPRPLALPDGPSIYPMWREPA